MLITEYHPHPVLKTLYHLTLNAESTTLHSMLLTEYHPTPSVGNFVPPYTPCWTLCTTLHPIQITEYKPTPSVKNFVLMLLTEYHPIPSSPLNWCPVRHLYAACRLWTITHSGPIRVMWNKLLLSSSTLSHSFVTSYYCQAQFQLANSAKLC